jgi:hypothetical protein
MNSVEEFSYIVAQLEWLERHVRAGSPDGLDSRMESALNAAACARAVIAELAQLTARGSERPDVAEAA